MRERVIRILLVEDSDDDVLMIRESFKKSKILNELAVVSDGQAAVDYLKNLLGQEAELPGLVLLDINMPKKNGFEVLDFIKNTDALRHLPVIMLTTSESEDDVLKSYQSGACSYIPKPVNIYDLKKVMEQFDIYWTMVSRLP